jgi:hypothetical protein
VSLEIDGMLAHLKGFFGRHQSTYKRPLYMVVKLPDRASDRQAWLRDLERFKNAVTHVIIIERCTHEVPLEYEGDLTAVWRCLNSTFHSKV